MSDNKLKEMKDKVVGSVKEGTGKVLHNEELELKGKLQKGVGEAREGFEDAKDVLEEKLDEAKHESKDKKAELEEELKELKHQGKEKKDELIGKINDKIDEFEEK